MEIHVPANCIVASYSMVIESLYKDGEEQKSVVFKYEKPVYILFNAWCPGKTATTGYLYSSLTLRNSLVFALELFPLAAMEPQPMNNDMLATQTGWPHKRGSSFETE